MKEQKKSMEKEKQGIQGKKKKKDVSFSFRVVQPI